MLAVRAAALGTAEVLLMQWRFAKLLLVVCVLAGAMAPCAFGQSAAQFQKAGQLYSQAVSLERDGKIPQAVAAMKQAAALAPKTKVLANYKEQLEALAGSGLDQHALQAPKEMEQSIASLADYLAGGAKDDREKARLIYRWITDRIAYDAEGFLSGKFGDNGAANVLKTRKCVCEGYANLFLALGNAAGLEVVKVHGYAKGVGYRPGQKITRSNHAWNAVKVDGQWRLVDSTWGAGALGDKKFIKRYRDYFFLTPQDQLIFSHLPDDVRWQLLEPPVPQADFERWPKINDELFALGISAKDVRAKLNEPGFRELVDPPRVVGPKVTVRTAPLDRYLKTGRKYKFQIEAEGFQEMIVRIDGKAVSLVRKGNVFEAELPAGKGDILVSGRFFYATGYWGVLRYKGE
jgi:hypothetical protein